MAVSNNHITSVQAFGLIVSQILGTSFLVIPGTVVGLAGVDAWISSIIAIGYGLFSGWLIVLLFRLYPNATLVQIPENILGRWLGKVVGFGYCIFFLISNSTVIRQGGALITTVFLPETPLIVIIACYMALVIYIAKMGMEVVARTNLMLLTLLIVSIFIILIASLENMDIPLLPIAGEGLKPILTGSIAPGSWLSQVIMVGMVLPYLQHKEHALKIIATGVIFTGIMQTLITVVTLAVLGLQTENFPFPVYDVAKLIDLDILWRRLDVMIVVMWIAGVFIKMAFWFYITVVGLSQVFELHDYRPLVIPLAILSGGMAMLSATNAADLSEYLGSVWPLFSLMTFEMPLPLLLLIIAWIRNRSKKRIVGGDSSVV
ncbi:GerAB/ArcD/ProY family transporter [Paenibacillus sedimenti]|uniref:Endospore germination permease n=1 Tax=Paenibacillus sedimenti TaxID=2770274 RepID=A0A926KTY5_9BACL|nr:endospore germination permease [Paenibacillus sedimenti]MBD0384079.1 endospore germination permease [Paenibacillus sedimenti]